MSGDLDAWRRPGRVHQKTGQTQKSQRWVVVHEEEGGFRIWGAQQGVRWTRLASSRVSSTAAAARCMCGSLVNSWTASADVVSVVWMQ